MAEILRVVKANRNHVKSNISQLLTVRLMAAAPNYTTLAVAAPPPQLKLRSSSSDPLSLMLANSNCSQAAARTTPKSTTIRITRRRPNIPFPIRIMCTSTRRERDCDGYGSPCLDLFFKVVQQNRDPPPFPSRDLERLLPLAWSHDPLTTLKLVCNLLDIMTGKFYPEAFYTAAYWLHHNHPKTLAYNIAPIAESFGTFKDPVEILNRLQAGQEYVKAFDEERYKRDYYYRDHVRVMAKKAVKERYERDPDYQLLHDRISDFLVEHLKSDIENFTSRLLKRGNASDRRYISEAADCCRTIYFYCNDRDFPASALLESIGTEFFPGQFNPKSQLFREVLLPLTAALESPENYYEPLGAASFVVDKYLEEVKAGKTKIAAGALLPHEIIRYVHQLNVREVAELQWMKMLEDIKKHGKNGKKILYNCLAVCDTDSTLMKEISVDVDVATAMGLLVSELSAEPWKGKVINYSDSPKLHLIQGDDLRSKCEFLRSIYPMIDRAPDFLKIFDLILEVAVNGNLKSEQMIRKVFVFSRQDFDLEGYRRGSWNTHYEAIQCKFKDKGYANAVPHIVFWTLSDYQPTKPAMPCRKPGMTILRGFSNDLLKLFLDNDGDIGSDHVMEAAISGKRYQRLAVVD